MKLSVFNGSPRGKNSNSSKIVGWLGEGILREAEASFDVYYLNRVREHDDYARILADSEESILIFPLYTDSMPGIVMAFIEKLSPFIGKLGGKKLGFIVHSSFPEAIHSRAVERYLESLCKLLGADYMGTAVLGGSEGFRIMPDQMTRRTRLLFNALGESLARHGRFEPDIVRKIAGRERFSWFILLIFRLVSWTGKTNFYWDGMLRENGAFDKRFAAPYRENQG